MIVRWVLMIEISSEVLAALIAAICLNVGFQWRQAKLTRENRMILRLLAQKMEIEVDSLL